MYKLSSVLMKKVLYYKYRSNFEVNAISINALA